MLKKLLFINLVISIIVNINNLSAETSILIPLKKPSLTDEEIVKKLTQNILIPIKKPNKIKEIKVIEKKITKIVKSTKDKKLSLKIQKKNPQYLVSLHRVVLKYQNITAKKILILQEKLYLKCKKIDGLLH